MPTQLVPPRQREPSAGDLVQQMHGMQDSTDSMDKAGTNRVSSHMSPCTCAGSLPEYQGSPEDVFSDLPEGVRIEVTKDRASEGSVGSCVDGSSGSFIVKLQKLPSHKLVLFPETAEGHVSQVRWYSFQFLLEELAEQMQDTVDAFDRLLERIQDVEHDEDGWVWM